MAASRGGGAKIHFRRLIVRCKSCGKSLATARVSRSGVEWVHSKGIQFDLTTGDAEFGDGGDSVHCTNRECGAGPRYFPDGFLARSVEAAAKRGEGSVSLELPGR